MLVIGDIMLKILILRELGLYTFLSGLSLNWSK